MATIVCVPTIVPGVYSPLALMSPTVLLPPETPSTDQLAAPPPGAVAVNCCVCHSEIAATLGDTVTFMTVTVTVAVLVPPLPVQLNEYAVLAASAPVL